MCSGLGKRKDGLRQFPDHVVALSSLAANEINPAGATLRGKISVVPFGVDLTRFDPMQVTAHRVVQLAKQWRVPDDLPVVMLPARFHKSKGHSSLLEAPGPHSRLDLRCIFWSAPTPTAGPIAAAGEGHRPARADRPRLGGGGMPRYGRAPDAGRRRGRTLSRPRDLIIGW